MAMAGLAAGKPDESCHSQPLATTSSDDPEHPVSVTDPSSSKNKSPDQDLESQSEDDDSREVKHEARRNLCCAWTSLFIGTIILVLLFLGTILFSFFASNMPTFHLSGLTVNKLQFNKTRTDVFMTSNILVTLNATNSKGQIQFLYTGIRADIFSNDIFLGRVHISGFHQKAKNSTELKLRAMINSQPVAEADASKMKSDLDSNSLNIDVNLNGVIHYKIRGHRISGFPFKVSCNDKVQSAINQKQQSCSVKLTPVT